MGIPKDVVDHTLECGGYVAQSKWHDSIFEEAISVTNSCIPFLSFLDSDEVVAVLEFDFVEVFHASNSVLVLIHVGERVTIGDRDIVDSSVVNVQV